MNLSPSENRILTRELSQARQWVLALVIVFFVVLFFSFVFIIASYAAIKPNHPDRKELVAYVFYVRAPIFSVIAISILPFIWIRWVYLLRIGKDNLERQASISIEKVEDRKIVVEKARYSWSNLTSRLRFIKNLPTYKIKVLKQWLSVSEKSFNVLSPGVMVHVKYLAHSKKVLDVQIVEITNTSSS